MSKATLRKDGDVLRVDLSPLSGLAFRDARERIQDIPGRQFDWDTKEWKLEAIPSVAERIVTTIQPEVDDDLMEWIKSERSTEIESLTTPLPTDADLKLAWARERQSWQPRTVNDEDFNGLLDYQRAAVEAIVRQKRVILADDVGLGKTIQSIAAVEEYKLIHEVDGPKLVTAPNSVKGSWMREIRRWLPPETPAYIIEGRNAAERRRILERAIRENAWCIINWEQLRLRTERVKLRNGGFKRIVRMKEPLFETTRWLATIADEVHRAKNRKSQQTKGLWRCQAPLMIGLTGTPLMNSPDELWAPLRWLFPKEYTAYWRWYVQYVDFWENPRFGKVIVGVKNPDALRFELRGRVIRRTAGQVQSLPGRRRIYFPVQLGRRQLALYREAESQMWLEIEQRIAEGDETALKFKEAAAGGTSPQGLYLIPNGASRMVRLQQILETPALLGAPDDSAIMDDFEERYVDSRPFQWVTFTKFKGSCDILGERLESKFGARVGVYNGDVRSSERTRLEDAFQRGELDVMVGTLDAMREGITLTSGHLMYFLTRAWVPAWNEQAEGREDRIGQQEKVMVYIPQAEGTVATSKIEPANRRKERIVKTVVNKDDIEVNSE